MYNTKILLIYCVVSIFVIYYCHIILGGYFMVTIKDLYTDIDKFNGGSIKINDVIYKAI